MDTFLPLIVSAYFGAAGGSAFSIFLLRQFVLGINRELNDAARSDGCGTLRLWWESTLPLEPTQMEPNVQQEETQPNQQEAIGGVARRCPTTHLPRWHA